MGIEGERVVACGGYDVDAASGTATLCWGMVHADCHGQGLGLALLQSRLEAIRQLGGARSVEIETSQHTASFYARHGFVLREVLPDEFGPGLHAHRMA